MDTPREELEKALAAGKNVTLRQYMELLRRVSAGEILSDSESKHFHRLKEELEREVEAQRPPTERTFRTLEQVAEYLCNRGFNATTSTVKRHLTKKNLERQPDGTFLLADVDALAVSGKLRRRDGKQTAVDELYQLRMNEETRKLRAQADHWEIRAKEAAGGLVPRSFAEDEIAARDIVYKSDLTNWIHTDTPVECAMFGGDPDKIPDVIAHKAAAVNRILGRYKGDREYTVELPPPKKPAEPATPIDPDEEEFEEA